MRSLRSCRRRRRGPRGAGAVAAARNAPRTLRRSATVAPRCRPPRTRSRSGSHGSSQRSASSRARRSAGLWPRSSRRVRSAGTNVSASASGGARRSDDERGSLGRQPPQAALLPAVDEAAGRLVVADRRACGRERDPPSRALPAALDRPRDGRAAARAERRLDPRQVVATCRAQLAPSRLADDAALRQEKVEHRLHARRERAVSVSKSGVRAIRRGCVTRARDPGVSRQKPVVGLEQLRVAPDVVPAGEERG